MRTFLLLWVLSMPILLFSQFDIAASAVYQNGNVGDLKVPVLGAKLSTGLTLNAFDRNAKNQDFANIFFNINLGVSYTQSISADEYGRTTKATFGLFDVSVGYDIEIINDLRIKPGLGFSFAQPLLLKNEGPNATSMVEGAGGVKISLEVDLGKKVVFFTEVYRFGTDIDGFIQPTSQQLTYFGNVGGRYYLPSFRRRWIQKIYV